MPNLNCLLILIALATPLISVPTHAWGQVDQEQRINQLEDKVGSLSQKISDHGDGGIALFLCGSFCALWAQQTGRNAWLWFFAGAFLNIITLLVLLHKNSQERNRHYVE